MSLSKKASASKKKAPSTTLKDDLKTGSSRFSTVGAPAQTSQSSRKGKRAWRKNVDIAELEEGLEELREEERVTGGPVQKMADEELFTIDLTGDDKVRQRVKTKKPLTSTMILSQRSAVPAVYSKVGPEKKKNNVTRAEKERLLRIGKRKRTGALNVAVDPTEVGSGSALLEPTEAVKKSGTYDVWMDVDDEPGSDDGFKPAVKQKTIKLRTQPMRDLISVPAISFPHQGTSYNPPIDAYKDLLQDAVKVEEKKEAEAKKYEDIKIIMDSARPTVHGDEVPTVEGMIVDIPGDDVDQDEPEVQQDSLVPNKAARRKTQQQRRKARRLLDEQRALREKAERKKMLASLESMKSLRKEVENAKNEQDRILAERKLQKLEQLKKGLVGQRLGKHKVAEAEIDVQMGEDLSDSLRGLKVEGNLFRDRLLSMQKRALVEPRTRVFPTRRKTKVKEMEKFAWKRFT
ncbi:hypothetical protein M408DRAFT_331493 [Serendipita vermifera MAFF 305830]|uniref:Ribosome biogenesis protein NOP53 n=1 Tax=Serendipita vermifera MAFF 305830 TaxID=933852 RepID=A0A0C3AYG5_SERVB|nr:hypothetical protein M408DRAFT_331493 [Serendipita vermifera MAFF 305830]